MFDDHWGRKQALIDYKNLAITKSPYWDFAVNPRFWLKIGNFLFVCFLQNKSRNNVWWSSNYKSSPQPIKGASNVFFCNKLFSLYKFLSKVSQPVSYAFSQPASQSVSQLVNQSASKSASLSASQPASHSVKQSER